MTYEKFVWDQLKAVTKHRFVRALLADGFVLQPGNSAVRTYVHESKMLVVEVHYHHGRDTFRRKTLKRTLEATMWTPKRMEELGLIKIPGRKKICEKSTQEG